MDSTRGRQFRPEVGHSEGLVLLGRTDGPTEHLAALDGEVTFELLDAS